MIAVIRIRGTIGTRRDIREAFAHLRLDAANQMTVLAQTPANKGLARKVRDYATYGTIDANTLGKVIAKRGRTAGNQRFDAQKAGKSAEEIAQAVAKGERKLAEFGIKPVFRLTPPKKGFERGGIKRAFSAGGVLGERGEQIGALINRMI